MVPDEVLAYGREFAASLQAALDGELVGAYYVGSVALGGYVPGQSDIDIVAVSEHAIPDVMKPSLADGRPATLDMAEVNALLDHVESTLVNSRGQL